MRLQATMDRAAIGFSTVCAAHCALLPVALILLPVLAGTFLGDESFHRMMIFGALPTSLLALGMGWRKHRKWDVVVFGLVGLGILVGAAVWGHDLVGEQGEKVATVLAAAILAFSHLRNQSLCAEAGCEAACCETSTP